MPHNAANAGVCLGVVGGHLVEGASALRHFRSRDCNRGVAFAGRIAEAFQIDERQVGRPGSVRTVALTAGDGAAPGRSDHGP